MIGGSKSGLINSNNQPTSWSRVLEFSLPAIPGCELRAVEKIAGLLKTYPLRPNRLNKLKEAVRIGASKMIEEASLSTSERLIDFQVLVSEAVKALHPFPDQQRAESAQVGWGFFLVQVLDGAQGSMESIESGFLLRLFVYIEGDQPSVQPGMLPKQE